jgi:hypothetical protein
MTNTSSITRENVARNFAVPVANSSDQAPMVVTRLSGWIDFGESKAAAPSWIVPTRIRPRN